MSKNIGSTIKPSKSSNNICKTFTYTRFHKTTNLKKFVAMHFIYYINRSIATKVDSTYLGY